MIILSENKINEWRNKKIKVYSQYQLHEGCECFADNKQLQEPYYISSVSARNVKHENGKFYFTNEDLSQVADFWPKHLLPIIGAFSSKKKHKLARGCLVDASGLPAFNCEDCTANEDVTVSEYRFYLTLFNDFTVSQLRYERHNLYDALFNSSKYDLTAKLQNSDFLKSKDFKVINYRRQEDESVPVGYVIREDMDKTKSLEYGKVFINMDNIISIEWH